MRVECFLGIRADQLRRVIENRDLGRADIVVVHEGTKDVRNFRNLDYIMGGMYDLLNMAKIKIPDSRLSGVEG